MGNILGPKPKEMKEILRENDRMIKRAVRDIEKEIRNLEREQTRIGSDIKKNAKAGQPDAAKALAKGYVRTKNYINRLIMMETQLKGMSLQMQTIKTSHAMSEAMKGVTSAMQKMNKQMDLPALNKIMADFMRENNIQELVQEEMGDLLDDALTQEGAEAEEEQVISQVMDELGIEFSASLQAPGTSKIPGQQTAAAQQQTPLAMGSSETPSKPSASGNGDAPSGAGGGGGGDVDINDIEARLKNLRK